MISFHIKINHSGALSKKPWHRSYVHIYIYYIIRTYLGKKTTLPKPQRSGHSWGGFVYKHHHLGFLLTGTLVAIIGRWSPWIHHPDYGRHLIILSFPNTTSTKLYPRALLEVWLFPGLSNVLDHFSGEKNTNSNSKRISTRAIWCGCCDVFLFSSTQSWYLLNVWSQRQHFCSLSWCHCQYTQATCLACHFLPHFFSQKFLF